MIFLNFIFEYVKYIHGSKVKKCFKSMLKETSPKLVCKMKYSLPLPYLLIVNVFSYVLIAERSAVDMFIEAI